MAWTRIDDGLPEHPKIYAAADLVTKFGYARVMAMIVQGLCYANRTLSDGFLPTKAVQNFHESSQNEVISALVSAQIWHKTDGGYRIHDYHDYQFSREEVERRQQVKSNQGRIAGLASATARQRKANGSVDQPLKHNSTEKQPHPLPSPPNPEDLTKNNKLECVSVSLPPAEPAHTHNGNGNGFDEKWETFKSEYPSSRRAGGFLCQQLFLTACGKVGFEKLLSALRAHKASADWKKGMIPGMQKFFEKELWIQEPEAVNIATLRGADAMEAATAAFLKANRK